jgi:hypothetical protein
MVARRRLSLQKQVHYETRETNETQARCFRAFRVFRSDSNGTNCSPSTGERNGCAVPAGAVTGTAPLSAVYFCCCA